MERYSIKCYAVCSGEYSDYRIHGIYRRRADAERFVEENNSTPEYLLDGVPTPWSEISETYANLPLSEQSGWYRDHVKRNPARQIDDVAEIEEFDYYEGEPTPGCVEVEG